LSFTSSDGSFLELNTKRTRRLQVDCGALQSLKGI
jgi:hypothetical protein